MSAGPLRERVVFEKQSAASDGAGGTTTAWADQFTRWAAYIHLKNGEGVMAGRLQGKHSQVVKVRVDPSTRAVSTDWRLRDKASGRVFNIRDISLTKDRAFLEMLCESGVA